MLLGKVVLAAMVIGFSGGAWSSHLLTAGFQRFVVRPDLLGMEHFGAGNGLYLATACFIAYRFSGHSGIYPAHRLAFPKFRVMNHDK